LSHTVTHVEGRKRIESVTIMEVDERRRPIQGSEKTFEVDALLLSVGLIPDNELTQMTSIGMHTRTNGPNVTGAMETSLAGVFACGNVLHVHDLVDYVSAESRRAAQGVIRYLQGDASKTVGIRTKSLEGISYIVPQILHTDQVEGSTVELFLRTTAVFHDAQLSVKLDGKEIKQIKKAHLAPAEMEHLTLDLGLLTKDNVELTVEVQTKEV